MALAGTFISQGSSLPFSPRAGFPFNSFNVTLRGTFNATVQVERSFDQGAHWDPRTSRGTTIYRWTGPASERVTECEDGALYRLRCAAFTSGTVTYNMGPQFAAIFVESAPINLAIPEITGTAQEDVTLTASAGDWANNPTSFAYQWKRDGGAIGLATASTYFVVAADIDAVLTVSVTATNGIGTSAAATSLPTAVVVEAPPDAPILQLVLDMSTSFPLAA